MELAAGGTSRYREERGREEDCRMRGELREGRKGRALFSDSVDF